MALKLPDCTLGEFILWLLRRRKRFRVTGNSMTPLLKPSDEVLIDPKAYQQSLPTPGDIIVTRHPDRSELKIIKRVELVLEDGRCLLKGDNRAESTDSRTFGPVPVSDLLGRVTTRFG